MACSLGFTPAECVEDHWCRVLDGERVGAHWRARCPLCGRRGVFEITVAGRSIKWNCHAKSADGKPACDHDEIRALLRRLLPCRNDRRPDPLLVREIGAILRKQMDPSEMRLRIGQVIWPELSASQVADELGLSRATRYRLRCPPRRVSP